jgi:hypothetical protein
MKKLYRFAWDCGRQGTVEGLFVADSDEVDAAIGERVYFGEILGKHSEIHGTLEASEIQVVADDPVFVQKFEEYDCASGYNPLDYLSKNREE